MNCAACTGNTQCVWCNETTLVRCRLNTNCAGTPIPVCPVSPVTVPSPAGGRNPTPSNATGNPTPSKGTSPATPTSAAGPACNTLQNCTACNNNLNCGWCTLLTGNSGCRGALACTPPNVAVTVCPVASSPVPAPQPLPACVTYSSCDTCAGANGGRCSWCAFNVSNDGICRGTGNCGAQATPVTNQSQCAALPHFDCDTQNSCDTCSVTPINSTSSTNCSWCQRTASASCEVPGACIGGTTVSNCTLANNCLALTTCGECSASPDGCAWCESAIGKSCQRDLGNATVCPGTETVTPCANASTCFAHTDCASCLGDGCVMCNGFPSPQCAPQCNGATFPCPAIPAPATQQPGVAPGTQPGVAPATQPGVAPAQQPGVAPAQQPGVAPVTQPGVAPVQQPVDMTSDFASTVAPAVVAPVDSSSIAPANAPVDTSSVAPVVAPVDTSSGAPVVAPVVAPASGGSTPATSGSAIAPLSKTPSKGPVNTFSPTGKSNTTAPTPGTTGDASFAQLASICVVLAATLALY